MTDDTARAEICKLGALLAARGLSPGTSGNISVRIGEGYVMTPTNASLGALEPESLSIVGADGSHRSGAKPTKEHFLHRAVYQAREKYQAIVHLHSTYAVGYSCLHHDDPEDAFTPITPYTVMRLDRVAVVPYVRPGDERLGDLVGTAARKHHAILLSNHGPIVAGVSLDAAAAAIEEFEESAKLYFLLRGHDAKALTAAQIDDLRAHFPS